MGGGTREASAPGTTAARSDSRPLEQLRWLVHRDFDPPLSSHELTQALDECSGNIQVAYHFLKERRRRADSERRHQLLMASVSASQPTTTAAAVAKRRLGLLEEREAQSATPSKRARSDQTEDALASQAAEDAEMATPQDVDRARSVLKDTVNVRAHGEQRGGADWASDMMTALQVQPLLEIVMALNLTADALAVWAKAETDQAATEQKRKALDDVVAAVALVQRQEVDSDRTRPIEEAVAKHEEEITVLKSEALDQQQSLRLRATAGQRLVESITQAVKMHLDRLKQLVQSDSNAVDPEAYSDALKEMEQNAARRVEDSTAQLKEADNALKAAREVMEARAKVLVAFINDRAKALVSSGQESEEGALWVAAMEVTHSNDDEIAAFRTSRAESEARARSCQDAVHKRSSKLTFDQNLLALVRTIQTERKRHDEAVRYRSQHAQSEMQQRTKEFVVRHLPTLIGALQLYFEFRSVQENAARCDQEKQEKELEELLDVYGDSAPIKKRDIEQRIAEFKRIRSQSAEGIGDMVKTQQELWTADCGSLSRETWCLVAGAYKELYHHSNGVVQDAMLVLMSSIDAEEARLRGVQAAGASTGEDAAPPAPPSADAQRQPTQLFPDIYGPSDAVVGSYRTAISPVVATDGVSTSVKPGLASPPARAAPIVNAASAAVPVKLEHTHEFALEAEVFTKFNIAEDSNQFFRGKIVELLPDGGYRVQYDDGDVFSVARQYLFTREQVAHELPQESSGAAGGADGNGCVVM